MFKSQKGYTALAVIGVVAVVLIVGVIAFNLLKGPKEEGILYSDGTSTSDPTVLTFLRTVASKVGITGTWRTKDNVGFCYIRPYAATIAASSTATVDCQGTQAWNAAGTINVSALTGLVMGDRVTATLSTTTAGAVSNGLVISGASASTTAGYIVLRISNLTGGVYTWPIVAGVASGTAQYYSGTSE